MADPSSPAKLTLDIFHAALTRVHGRKVVRSSLVSLSCAWRSVSLVALGKAALAMTQGALDVLGDRVRAGLIVTKTGHGGSLGGGVPMRILEAAHPLPDASSLYAGQALLDFLRARCANAPGERFLFLLSGGSSSLVESLPGHCTLEDLRRVNAWLLGSGLDIHQMNRIRKRFSVIKGGRLARHLEGEQATALLLSDVPGDDPGSIGSGLLVPDKDDSLLPEKLPGWLEELLMQTPPLLRPDDPLFSQVAVRVVGRLADALAAAAARARSRGYPVRLVSAMLTGDAAEQGRSLAMTLLQGEPGIYLWGGETTVVLPPHPGKGGRNQQCALSAARVIQGRNDCILLAAGTDGSDGDGPWAGALVDGGTLARGRDAGLDPEASLAQADAQTFLAASGGLLSTGPTGTNVMDLVIGLKMGALSRWMRGDNA
ncbi:MAG: DUF4147 domain-containing protein [Magnetococcales bacterium]|nr:DUF4147 domain-containing protein [Magnetococcales bacterium]